MLLYVDTNKYFYQYLSLTLMIYNIEQLLTYLPKYING